MKINDIEVTIRDFERLDGIMTRAIQEIDLGDLNCAKEMLRIARNSINSINKNLIAERNSNQNIEVGDDVEITYLEREYDEVREKLLGVQCYVESKCCVGSYTLQPKSYKDLVVKEWVFEKRNLTLI